jgi:2-desacetyl-2-hydroxyethyl bacteriochlorophyllide A dehydrogenase
MKAAVFNGVGVPLRIQNIPDPQPGKGEIVLRVGRCGICGSDLHMTDGTAPMQYPLGAVPGHEFAGEVVAIGKEVERIRVGDFVTALPFDGCGQCAACLAGRSIFCANMVPLAGGFAQYIRTREKAAMVLPRTLSMTDGALIEPLAVGLHGVTLAKLRPGARVLVIGAGPVGLAATFWARRLGAGSIAVTASSRRREGLARQMGADAFVLPEADEELANLAVNALGGMPDVVVEAAGVAGMLAQAIQCVRPGGTICVLGFCVQPDAFLPCLAVFKEACMRFAVAYSMREFEHVARVLDSGAIEPRAMVTDQIGLDQLPGAFEALRSRTHQCKVVVDPST